MSDGSLRALLRSGKASNYQVQTATLTVNLAILYETLLPAVRAFVDAAVGGAAGEWRFPIPAALNWQKRPDIVARFFALNRDERVEALSYFMVPIHEYRHHFDMLSTPFGAWVHVLAMAMHLNFQSIAWPIVRILDRPGLAGPAKITSLEAWLKENQLELDESTLRIWRRFELDQRAFEAWGDFDGVRPHKLEPYPDPNEKFPLMGLWLKPVLVNGLFETFTPQRREPWDIQPDDWVMTPSTILEGRAVLASLLWAISQLAAHPETGPTIAEWLRRTYDPNIDRDYRFIPDLAAAWTRRPNLEALLDNAYPLPKLAALLGMLSMGTWVALHAPPPRPDENAKSSNPCISFYAVLYYIQMFMRDHDSFSTRELDCFDNSELAQRYGVRDCGTALAQSITILESASAITREIQNPQVARHFSDVGHLLHTTLSRRLQQKGYWSPTAYPTDGNLLARCGEEDEALIRPYEAPYWASQWFEFRRKAFFRPSTATATAKYLFGQFALDTALINCECGAMISAEAPRFLSTRSVTCNKCGRKHLVRRSEATMIRVDPED